MTTRARGEKNKEEKKGRKVGEKQRKAAQG